jgi:hypothetical protein
LKHFSLDVNVFPLKVRRAFQEARSPFFEMEAAQRAAPQQRVDPHVNDVIRARLAQVAELEDIGSRIRRNLDEV